MLLRPALASLVFALLLGCSSSTPKPADGAESDGVESPPSQSEPVGEAAPSLAAPPAVGAAPREAVATDVLDDYLLTANDCQALGRRYADAAGSDQRIGLSPKLTEKQRAQADANIDNVVIKLGTQWGDDCMTQLVGQHVEHKKIRCALAAKTVKTFDVCLNGKKK